MPKLLQNLEAISLLYKEVAEDASHPSSIANCKEEFIQLAKVKYAVEQIAESPCYINLDMSKVLDYSKYYSQRS